MVAALFVETDGVYFGLPDVDPWDVRRDARLYAGPYPVIAHPPCARWGRYWGGGPSAKVKRVLGDDDGCFAAALAAVRKWGGVLEHPEGSHAWRHFGLVCPPKGGGWIPADFLGGQTCCVEQGHYGHRARKATWLYTIGCNLSELKWGKSDATLRLDNGHRAGDYARIGPRARISTKEVARTPVPFRDVLRAIAATYRTHKCALCACEIANGEGICGECACEDDCAIY